MNESITSTYRYWRLRILYSTIIGYAIFYFVRTNIGVALPAIQNELHISKSRLGAVLTAFGLVYGLSKFINGFVGDRVNPRYFMSLGLICSAAMNVGFGLSSAVVTFAIFWLLNGWFQGMGFPPCAKSIAHWFAPGERSTNSRRSNQCDARSASATAGSVWSA
jgi:OPA family glycerol-3-phosphate transporter-like MFS transporter/OPA family sugar phosphate sensor protein UhpC-like MFS transporter